MGPTVNLGEWIQLHKRLPRWRSPHAAAAA